MSKTNPEIFKAYDIRGIYGKDLDEDTAYKIGQAYTKLMSDENPNKKLTFVVSGDMRISTPALKKSLIQGLTDSGADVVDIGMASTPTFYFAVAYNGHDGGIQVSASHNPAEYNGFKMVRKNAVPVSGDTGIQTIKDWVISNEFPKSDKAPGKVSQLDGQTKLAVDQQSKDVDISQIKPLKVVIDAANSVGSLDLDAVLENLPLEVIKLNWELDGTFPAHQADPLHDENLDQIKAAVLEHQADLGIAPDGDGDRYFFIDETGHTIRQEILRGIMAQISLKEHPGSVVAYDIRPGRITLDMIQEAGGKPIVTRVGHSLIKEQMLKENAVFGGESSGHYFYRFDYGTFEAPTSLLLRLLKFISEQNKPLSQIIKPYQKYFHSGEINSVVDDTEAKIKAIHERFSDAKINDLDGVTVEYDDYWFNVRPSNTEPKLRLNLEAKSSELMEQKRDEVLEFIRS